MKTETVPPAPKISVLLPVYNGAKYLDTTLGCLIDQTYPDFEVLVCDDSSTDNSRDILLKWAQKDKRIRLMQHPINMGVFQTQKDLAAQARCEFIAQQDQDDYSAPERFEVQTKLLTENPEAAGTVSNVWLVDEAGEPIGITDIPLTKELLAEAMRHHNVCFHSSFMMRRAMFEQVGGYNKEADHVADYDLLLRLLKQGPLIPSALPLATYGLSPGTVTYRDRATQVALAQEIRHRHFGTPKPITLFYPPIPAKQAHTNYHLEVGKLYFAKGKMAKARQNFKSSFHLNPRVSAGAWLAISFLPSSLVRALKRLKKRRSPGGEPPAYFLKKS